MPTQHQNAHTTSSLENRILRALTGSVGVRIVAIGLGLLSTVYLGRLLGVENFGLYIFVYTLIRMVGIPVLSGLPTLITRETAKLQQNENWSALLGFWIRCTQWATIYVLFAVCIFYTVLGFSFSNLSDSERVVYSIAPLILILASMAGTLAAIVAGLRKVVWAQIPDQILRPVLIVFVIVSANNYFSNASFLSAWWGIVAHIFALVFAVGTLIVVLWKIWPSAILRGIKKDISNQKQWYNSLVPLTVLASVSVFYTNADILMLGFLTDYEDVGLYRVASRGAVLLSIFLYAANSAIGPYVARLYAADDKVRLQSILSNVALVVFVCSLPLFLSFVIFGEQIIRLGMGEEYVDAVGSLLILGVGQMINVVTGSVALILNMTGNEASTARGAILAAFLNIVLNVPLILLYGIEGAAVATAISLSALNIYHVWQLYKRTGLLSLAYPPSRLPVSLR